MAFWTSQKILERLAEEGQELIRPIPGSQKELERRVKCGAYELAVAKEYYVTSMEDGREAVTEGKQLAIPPGQLALLITEESLNIPNDVVGLISIKFGKKKKGLINVSGFHVDPGFQGKLEFSVYNAGSRQIVLDPGKPLFLIWFSDLESDDKHPYSKNHQHNNQNAITDEDVNEVMGEIASPGQLKREIDKLNNKVDRYTWIVGVLAAGIATWAVKSLLE